MTVAERGSAVNNEISPKKELAPSLASSRGTSDASFGLDFLYQDTKKEKKKKKIMIMRILFNKLFNSKTHSDGHNSFL